MRVEFNHSGGPPEIVREDGWRYRLDGVIGLDVEYEDCTYARLVIEVTIFALTDETFDSIRVLRDEFSDYSIRLIHDY